jgi:SWI/SNF related-matrix-associated actin-dependent regulator of chromatin subfamily C
VRKERDDESNAAVETPSKKSKHVGKNEVATPIAEDGNNGELVAPSPDVPSREVYRIPSHAAWFQWGKIHPLERRALSEFFDKRSAAKTPRIYKEYRDFIINKYRENPKQPLTLTEVRRMLVGDVNSLSRVFDFLEHWGLINHPVSLEPAAIAPEAPSPVIGSYPSGVRVVDMPAVNAAKTTRISTFESSGHSVATNNLATRNNVFVSPSKKLGPGSKTSEEEVHCHSCKKDCSKQPFHRKQQPDVSFCSDCVKNGKLPAGASASDFVNATDGDHIVAVKEWTSKETLLLLEAVSRFGENWTQVAAHVPTRSKAECVKHFIQLPFGDNYCAEPEEPKAPLVAARGTPVKKAGVVSAHHEEAVVSGNVVSSEAPVAHLGPSGEHAGADANTGTAAHDLVSPFTDTSHPLFAQVALLSGMVGPRVAAAAAQAAVAAVGEDDPGVSELPFMQSSKTSAGRKKRASTTMQDNGESAMEESKDEMQPDGADPQREVKNSSPPPNHPDASEATEELPSAAQARVSVATALGVAAANATLLADQEERVIEHLVASIIDNQMKKLYTKLEHFEELEMLLEKERLELERARQQVYADRLRYAEAQTATQTSLFRSPAPT